jgi:hypothetical protein
VERWPDRQEPTSFKWLSSAQELPVIVFKSAMSKNLTLGNLANLCDMLGREWAASIRQTWHITRTTARGMQQRNMLAFMNEIMQ